MIALVVLTGFGLLFLFAFDEGMQGADRSLESITIQQAKDIESLKGAISQSGRQLAQAASAAATPTELARVTTDNRLRKKRIGKLIQQLDADEAALAAATNDLKKYKEDYRTRVRSKAKGRTMEQLQTRKGKIYLKVSLRNVTEFGAEIRHEGGAARIPPEDLPAALQDEFLFDPLAKAHRAEDPLDPDEAADPDPLLENQRTREDAAARQQRIRSIATKEARIDKLKEEIHTLEQALLKEKFRTVSKAPQMRALLDADKTEMDNLQNEVYLLRDQF